MACICKHLGLGDFNKWSEVDKNNFLSKEFNSKRPLISKAMKFDKDDNETWATFKMISKLPKRMYGCLYYFHGIKSIRYIDCISPSKKIWY